MVDRVDHLAKGLAKEFGWEVNKGTEWDKVVGIFALNTVCLPSHEFLSSKRRRNADCYRWIP